MSDTSLRVYSLAELLADPPTPPAPVIAPWLREGEAAMLFAPTGAGKSMFALTLALAVAGGGSVIGWGVPTPRRVLLIDGEMSKYSIVDRLRKLAPAAGLDAQGAKRAAENLWVLARQAQPLERDFPDLADDQGRETILAVAREHGAEIAILDNFSTLATIEDENAAGSFAKPNLFIKRLKQAGIASLVIHHAGKGARDGRSARYRGSSNFATTFDAIIGLTPLAGSRAGGEITVELAWEKYRHEPDETIRKLDLSLVSKEGALQWQHERAQSDVLADVVEALRSGEVRNLEELGERIGASRATAARRVKEAEARGLLKPGEASRCFKAAKGAAEGDAAAEF